MVIHDYLFTKDTTDGFILWIINEYWTTVAINNAIYFTVKRCVVHSELSILRITALQLSKCLSKVFILSCEVDLIIISPFHTSKDAFPFAFTITINDSFLNGFEYCASKFIHKI